MIVVGLLRINIFLKSQSCCQRQLQNRQLQNKDSFKTNNRSASTEEELSKDIKAYTVHLIELMKSERCLEGEGHLVLSTPVQLFIELLNL